MPTTRRQFLAASSAAIAASTLKSSVAVAAKKKDRFAGLPIGVQSYSLRGYNVTETIRHTEGMGLHFIEFYGKHFSPTSTPEQIKEMLAVLKKANITISAHGVNGFKKDHDANRKTFEFCKAAGIRNITANPSKNSFDSLDRLCEEYDIRIAIHNHGPGASYDKLTDVTSVVKDRHENIGACVDTGHVIRSAEDPVKWIRELGPRVFALHIKDCAEQVKRTHNVIIGSGHLDVVGTFKALKDIKFPSDGSISLEYEANPQNPIDDIKQCLDVAEKAIAKANS